MEMNKLGGNLKLVDNRWIIGETNLLALAKQQNHSFYIYDSSWLKERYNLLKQVISHRNNRIFFAMKSNFNPALLKEVRDMGAGIDAVSPAEVLLALKIGFSPDKIIYTANNITDGEMIEVASFAQGEILFNIGSLSRLEKFGKAYPGRNVCLRFNPGVVAGEHPTIQTGGDKSKFGIQSYEMNEASIISARYGLTVVGIHKHTGSGIDDSKKYFQSVTNLLHIADKKIFPHLQFIDIGGGFKVPYKEDENSINYPRFGFELSQLFSDYCQNYGRNLQLYLEPGKYLSSECGYFIIQVNTLKMNGQRNIAGTNSGFNQLLRPLLYQAYHQIINLSNPQGSIKTYDICGNLCEAGDVFAVDRDLPEIREGDYLCILNAGAYSYSMSSLYNLRSRPAEFLINHEGCRQVTSRQSNEQLVHTILEEAL